MSRDIEERLRREVAAGAGADVVAWLLAVLEGRDPPRPPRILLPMNPTGGSFRLEVGSDPVKVIAPEEDWVVQPGEVAYFDAALEPPGSRVHHRWRRTDDSAGRRERELRAFVDDSAGRRERELRALTTPPGGASASSARSQMIAINGGVIEEQPHHP